MPTNKRKMDRKRCKQPNIFEKRIMNDWGLIHSLTSKIHRAVRAMNAFEQPRIVNRSTALKTHAHHQSHALFMCGGQLIVV